MATSIRVDTTGLERARWVAKNSGLHLSKTTIRTFRACPKAYRLEKIDRLPGSAEATAAQARGTAVHAALEAVLRHAGDQEIDAVVEEALDSLADFEEAALLVDWVRTGLDYVDGQGGTITVVEDFAKLDRSQSAGFTLHARLDVVVEGGRAGGVEVVDFKTATMCPTPRLVRMDAEAGIHRLIIGGTTPLRPVSITQLHLPSATPVTVQLTDEEVLAAWNDVIDARDAIRRALESGIFEATPGAHCAGCQYRTICVEARR
jgi:putative RecB family exonuclease